MIEWSTVEQWVRDWLDVINYTFYNAIKVLDVSPFNSSIRVIDTAMTAVEGVALVLVSMFFAIQLCNDTMLLKLQATNRFLSCFSNSFWQRSLFRTQKA